MGKMRIAVGSDHAAVALKQSIVDHLSGHGYEVRDLGTTDPSVSVDYPDYGAAVGRAVATGTADFGIALCGSGIGISIAANKIAGVRAAVISDVTTGRLAREHNHANVICLGARVTGINTALDAVDAFLTATPQAGRHLSRLAKLAALDDAASLPPETKEQ
jgi:ribose 5-phosphate isomerase B